VEDPSVLPSISIRLIGGFHWWFALFALIGGFGGLHCLLSLVVLVVCIGGLLF